MKKTAKFNLLAPLLCAIALPLFAQEKYMEPPKEIVEMMTAPSLPTINFSNGYKKYAEIQCNQPLNVTDIESLALPKYRIAGIGINPANFTSWSFVSNFIRMGDVTTGQMTDITDMPENAQISGVKWSPNDKYLCFLNHTPTELELWRIDVSAAKAQKINVYPLNSVLGENYAFIDEERILYQAVPEDWGAMPQPPAVPTGPIIQENYGKNKSLRTNTNLLTCYYDEQLFDYFATSQFVIFSPEGSICIGPKAIIRSYILSPNKNYMLVTTEHKPYSYQEPHTAFPNKLEIWNIQGEVIALLEEKTEEEDTSTRGASPNSEPRKSGYIWRNDMPATLVWTESLTPPPAEKRQQGDDPPPKYTTALYQQHAPFNGEKELIIRPENKISPVTWGNTKFALFSETLSKEKIKNTYSFIPCDTAKVPVLLFSESTEVDSLNVFPVIGNPYLSENSFGRQVVYVDDKLNYIYLLGARQDSEGDKMNFIDRFDLKTKKATNLWRGKAPYSERVMTITDFKNLKFISLRSSVEEVPNYYTVDPKSNKHKQITFYSDPNPAIRNAIQSRFITYQRKDGVHCSAILYLPAGYDPEKDGKLPVYMRGYPREYKCVKDAEKSRPDRYGFATSGQNHIYLAMLGYAVLDNFSMYIIAPHTKAKPNDVFREQLIMNAEAAIDFIDSMGIGDRNRVGVGGHSYGAFMTANLLAHTKLFKAGIAESGAYNRTLTHNGFQNESRTYWQAPQLYYEMSPFAYANQIKTPILLIHGQMDKNNGTFPIQSERLFHALSGLGGNVRYVQFPCESHGYLAIESQLHMMYEMLTFLDKHVKNATHD